MSLWLIMSFLKENHIWEKHTLIYEITQRWLLSSLRGLEKMIQLGWFGTPTILFLSSLEELGIVQTNDKGGSWMKRISKSLLVSKIQSIKALFFQTFCEKSLRLFKIMPYHCPQLSELICSSSPRVFNTF